MIKRSVEFVRRYPVLSAASVLHAVAFANAFWGPLRTTHPAANYLVAAIGFALAWSLVLLALKIREVDFRVVVLIPVGLWVTACSVLGLACIGNFGALLRSGVDHSFEPIGSWEVLGRTLRAYRTNGGATTSFGIVVRSERQLVPGLVWARTLYVAYPGYEVRVTPEPPGRVRIESPAYRDARRFAYTEVVDLH